MSALATSRTFTTRMCRGTPDQPHRPRPWTPRGEVTKLFVSRGKSSDEFKEFNDRIDSLTREGEEYVRDQGNLSRKIVDETTNLRLTITPKMHPYSLEVHIENGGVGYKVRDCVEVKWSELGYTLGNDEDVVKLRVTKTDAEEDCSYRCAYCISNKKVVQNVNAANVTPRAPLTLKPAAVRRSKIRNAAIRNGQSVQENNISPASDSSVDFEEQLKAGGKISTVKKTAPGSSLARKRTAHNASKNALKGESATAA